MSSACEEVASLGASEGAVRHHYDLSNDFYELWLDGTMTYSCAMWAGAADLRAAQEQKLRFHCESARARDARRVLDVGCGWGGLLKYLVSQANVEHAVGLTLSQAQADWIRRAPAAGIDVRVESWEEHLPQDQYDAIISIGALEHFARPDIAEAEKVLAYRRFFTKCHEWLRPGGYLSLQTIAYGSATRADLNRFIIENIFPESDLPTLAALDQACRGLFEIVTVRNDRLDYERTLKDWYFSLRRRRVEAAALVGEQTVRSYEKYFSLFMIGFHTGAMGLLRLALRRNDTPR